MTTPYRTQCQECDSLKEENAALRADGKKTRRFNVLTVAKASTVVALGLCAAVLGGNYLHAMATEVLPGLDSRILVRCKCSAAAAEDGGAP